MSTSSTKSVYNSIYSSIDEYNYICNQKNDLVDVFAQKNGNRILDAGCGQGNHLKRLAQQGFEVLGVEVSSVCCEKHLSDVPHVNQDINSYCKSTTNRFDAVICMDVLEHLPNAKEAEDVVSSLAKIAPSALFGLANHSDTLNGVELHLIQENQDWWSDILRRHYEYCQVYKFTKFNERFFAIECSNKDWDINKMNLSYSLLWSKLDERESSLEKFKVANIELADMITNFEKEIIKLKTDLKNEKRITSHPAVKTLIKVKRIFNRLAKV